MRVRLGDPQIRKEHFRHLGVVMLTRVDDDVFVAPDGEGFGDWCQLDELRTGTDDADDLHRLCAPVSCTAECTLPVLWRH
jgi:hypothetical protein